MKRAVPSLLSQGVVRAAALALPLVVVLGVRQFGSESLEAIYFGLLTDVALLVAFAKIGVDVYLPGCVQQGGVVAVHRWYHIAFASVVALLGVIAVVLMVRQGYWALFATSAFVLCALAYAEAGRLEGRFSRFYFFKAPSAYIGSLLACLLGVQGGMLAGGVAFIGIALFALLVARDFGEGDNDIDLRSLAVGALVSLLMVVFSWKEAAAARYVFDGQSLAALVTYSRLALVVTFLFMLRNARVPLVMRSHDDPSGPAAILDAIRTGRRLNVLWGLAASIAIVAAAAMIEPDAVPGVSFLMAGTCVLVAFGNIGACLVFLRDYAGLVEAHVSAFFSFVVALAFFSASGFDDVFSVVAMSALLAQVVLSWRLRRHVMKRLR